jgi:hypothetical protein
MKNFKWVYLFLALLLPILLSLFLKYFGKSEFNIPVYYESAADSLSRLCDYPYQNPYVIPDSIRAKTGGVSVAIITIDSAAETKNNFERIREEVDGSYKEIVLKNDSLTNRLMSCFLFLNKPWTTVLVDDRNRIRGYYAPGTREETDRLIVELKILLKQY